MSFHQYLVRLRRYVTGTPWPRQPVRRDRRPLQIERLEDRTVPATNITIISGAAGTGNLDHFLSATHGTITTADDPGNVNGTLSVGALQGVGAGVTISIAADSTIHFNDIGSLTLQTGTGTNAGFTTTTGAIDFANVLNTLNTGGGSLTFSAGTNLTVGNLNTNGGNASLTAGTTGPAGAGGNLQFENILTNGSGNLLLQATAGTSNNGTLTQSGSTSTAVGQAINATATGNVSVNSLRGTTVNLTSNTGAVTSAGSAAVQASAELIVSADTGITLNTLAASLEAVNNTSGDISITQLASPAQTLTILGSGVINHVSTGAVSIINDGASITVASSGNGIQSNNGTVTLAATDLQINGTVNSGTARTILTASVAGRQIDLGTNTPGKVGLTQAELNEVTAGVLQVGSAAAGTITVSAAITNPASWNVLTLVNGGTITEAAAGSLTLPNLRVSSTGPVTLTSANDVVVLAADATNSFAFSNGTNSLTVGVVDGDTGIVTTNSDSTLTADNLDVQQQINAGTGRVTLQPFTDTLGIDLGSASVPGSTYGLTDTELGQVAAGVLQVGNTNVTGGLTISSAITRHAGFNTLDLITGAGVSQSAALSVANLAVQAGSQIPADITLTNAGNDVDRFAAADAGSGNNITYTDTNGFTVSTVDGVAGISTTGSGAVITLTAGGTVNQDTGADITGDQLLLLGSGPYFLTDSGNDVNTLAASVTNDVSYTDANDLTIGTVNGTVGVTTNGHDINVTAGAVTSGTTLTVSQAINTTSTANITLSADQISLLAAVNAQAGIVTLEPTTAGRAVTLGTTFGGTLSLLQTDLNNVTAGVLRIGNLSGSGSITVTAPISDAGLGWSTLSLLTELGAGISQNAAATLTVTNLNAAGNTGVALNENNVVSTLAGATENGAFSFVDSTNLTVDNVDSGLGSGFGSGIITQTQAVSLTVNVINDSLTVNQTIDTTHSFGAPASGGANINLSADNMALNNNSPSSTINAGTGGVLTLTPFTPTNTIAAGGPDAAGQLGIDDNDLSNVTAKVVRIGSSAQSGAITIDGTINAHASYNTLDLIATGSGGAITQTTGSIAVANLALRADASIGSGGAVQVVGPINLAFRNVTSNNVQITSTGALTITAVDTLDGTTGNTIGNFASGGTTTLTASSPMTFAINTTSSGTLSATTTETASEANPGQQLPPPDDDLTVNSGVTVESTGGDVVFTSGDSIVTQSGSVLKSDTGTVNLTTGQGDKDSDATLELNGTISAANISLSSPGDICVNGLTATGAVTITSTNGAILDCGDTGETEPASPTNDFSNGASVDITAGTLQLSASTGIGTVSGDGVGPLETQVGTLGADTGTGGIFITNGVTSAITLNVAGTDGVQVSHGQGAVQLVNQGSINITTGNRIVGTDTGSITIEAIGAASDLVTGNGGAQAVEVFGTTNAAATLSAGRNLVLGTAGKAGSVFGGGPVVLTAGGNITLDEKTEVASSGVGNGITATAGGDINLNATTTAGAAFLAINTGPITLTTGAGGVFTLNSGAGGQVNSSGGNITISADDMVINNPIDAGAGIVTLQQASTTTRAIDLGGGTTPGDLGLSDAELAQVTAGVLRIGRTDNAGSITITAPVTTHAGYSTLSLLTGGSVSETGTGAVSVTNLAVQASGGADLSTNASAVSNVAATDSAGGFALLDSLSLTVTTVDGLNGIGTSGGIILDSSVANTALTVSQSVTSSSSDVQVAYDNMTLGAAVSAAGRVTLVPFTSGQLIDLGGPDAVGTLGLDSTDLGNVTAATLQVGDSTSGDLTVSNTIALTNVTTLHLETGGGIVQAGGSVTVADLALSASTGIGNVTPLVTTVANLAFSNLASGAVQVSNTGAVTIKAVDAILAAVNQGAFTTLTTVGAMLFAVDTTSAGTLTATANEAASGSDDLTVNGGVTVQSTGGDVVLQAGDNIDLQGGSTVQSGTGNVTLDIGFNDNDADGSGLSTIAGTVIGTNPTVNGGSGPNNLLVDFTNGASLPNGLTFNGGSSGLDTLAVSDANGAAAHTYTLSDVSVVRDGTTIAISNLAGVLATGGNLGDTFFVTPSATTTFTVNGGLPTPPASPGDTLNVNLAGTTSPVLSDTSTPSGFQGDWTFGNRKAVNFTGIETLAPTADLSITQHGPATAPEGTPLTYTLTVHNGGPGVPGTVTVTDVFAGGPLASLTAQASQGTFSILGNTVTFSLGALGGGATATLTVTAVPKEEGTYSNSATVSGNLADPVPGNNSTTTGTTGTVASVSGGGVPVASFESSPLVLVPVAAFSHAGGAEPAGNFSATINWGDGTSSAGIVVHQGSSYAVLGSHTYGDAGTYAVSVHVIDGSASATFTSLATIGEALLPPGSPHGPVGTPNERFVAEVYHDLFGLPVDPRTLAHWGRRLDRGLSRHKFVFDLLEKPPLHGLFDAGLVQDLYQTFRGRPATDAEVVVALRTIVRHGFLAFARRFLGTSQGRADAEVAVMLVETFAEPAAG